MSETYLVRAKLEWFEYFYRVPQQLPVKFGQFLMNYSPNSNSELWGYNRGSWDPDPEKGLPQEDKNYPISLLYVETEIEVGKGQQHPASVVDDILEQLEAMLRLFQAGGICLRRHQMWVPGEPRPVIWWDLPPPPIKAEPASLDNHGDYKLANDTLGRFIDFFNSYWDIVRSKPEPLNVAISRFSSSYEKRTLADRLVELMIAMEALFGSRSEVTFKISLRSACMLYPAGEARNGAFDTIKKLYDERSDIVHGKSLTSKSDNERINQFEDYVRRSIVKFFQLHKDGRSLSSEKELDKLLFFTKVEER